MRIVFMGTPDFASEALKSLKDNDYNIAAVVTQPDKPKGRGKKILYSDVKNYALSAGLDILQPINIKDPQSIAEIASYKPDLIVTAAYGQLLPVEILNMPKYGCINIHASLLPAYRGSAPIQWSVIHGEKESGVSIMYMDIGMDTGDIIYQEKVTINEDMTAGQLYDQLKKLGGNLVIKTIESIKTGNAPRIKQDESAATHAPILTKDTGKIDWNKTGEEIFNLIRGTNPWPVAYTNYKGKKLKVYKSKKSGETIQEANPGTIIDYNKGKGLLVATGDGSIYLEEIQFPNKKRMHIDDYLKGNNIDIGGVFL